MIDVCVERKGIVADAMLDSNRFNLIVNPISLSGLA